MLTNPVDSGLRRRTPRSNTERLHDQHAPPSEGSPVSDSSNNEGAGLSDMPRRKHTPRWMVQQHTLWALSLTLTALSGVMVSISVSQNRPTAYIPSVHSLRGDVSFWVQLSQLCLQLLSIYCTLVPLLRDGDFPVRKLRSSASIGVAIIMGILTPGLYVFSWKASSVAGYIGSVAAVIALVQLVGGMENVMKVLKNK